MPYRKSNVDFSSNSKHGLGSIIHKNEVDLNLPRPKCVQAERASSILLPVILSTKHTCLATVDILGCFAYNYKTAIVAFNSLCENKKNKYYAFKEMQGPRKCKGRFQGYLQPRRVMGNYILVPQKQ